MVKRPLGVWLIGGFYAFGAVILLLTVGMKQDIGFNVRFGVPFLPETAVRIFVALFSLVMAYGYLQMKKWGYRTIMVYSLLFLLISLRQFTLFHSQPFLGNAVFSVIVLVYSFLKRAGFRKTVNAAAEG